MYNPITFIKDVLDILKDGGPGDAIGACEITPEHRQKIINTLGPRSEKYAKLGDFLTEFETTVTIVPAKDFRKHYAFDEAPPYMVEDIPMTPVRTIKSL